MKKIIALLVALLIALPAFAAEAPLSGEIVAADKHGNVSTNLPASELFGRFALGDLLAVTINGERITAPLVNRYSDVNMGEPLVFASGDGQTAFAVNYRSFQDTYGATPGTAFEIELLQAKGYLDQFEIRNLVKSESREDYATDEIFANFRPVIEGVLYRGANPVLADDPRSEYAMKLVKAAGIKSIVNLAQTDEELAEMGADYEGLNYLADGMSADVTSEDFAPAVKKALEFIVANDGPFYVHCNEGKDRAGIICAIIESAIGFTPEQIVEDYMLSYVNYYNIEKGTEKYELLAQQIKTIMEQLLGAPMNADTLASRAGEYLANTVGIEPDALAAKLEG